VRPRLLLVLLVAAGLAALAPGALAPAAPSTALAAAPAAGNPFAGRGLFVDPHAPAARTVRAWRAAGRSADADRLARIARAPRALWLADWTGEDPAAEVAAHLARARAARALPVLVAYRLPDRDCGGASAGGAADAAAYRAWIDRLAAALSGPAAVIVEPDALASLDCTDDPSREQRTLALIRHAAQRLAARPAVAVYLDAGHSAWQPASVMAERLERAGVARARGFSLNVSNHRRTEDELAYGRELSALTGGRHFVVDTSRNGAGPAGDDWCNARGRALGRVPTAATGEPRADAFLWVKSPGESDGPCHGGPAAGEWWPEGALALARRAA
jgi:endoglucanase